MGRWKRTRAKAGGSGKLLVAEEYPFVCPNCFAVNTPCSCCDRCGARHPDACNCFDEEAWRCLECGDDSRCCGHEDDYTDDDDRESCDCGVLVLPDETHRCDQCGAAICGNCGVFGDDVTGDRCEGCAP